MMAATATEDQALSPVRHYVVTRHSVAATIKRAFPGWTIHSLHQVGIQGYRWVDVSARIDDVEKYRKQGYDCFSFKLTHANGGEAYPDYFYWEIGEPFEWRPNDRLEVDVNQGVREAYVLAVLGDEALIEYEMPKGTTALWVVSRYNPDPGCRRVISYRSCPKKWLDAITDAGTVWECRPQTGYRV
jgi:hypothetical protein